MQQLPGLMAPLQALFASMSRSSKQTHESAEDETWNISAHKVPTLSTLCPRSLSFSDMHSFFRCIALSRGNFPFYSLLTRLILDDGKKLWFLSIVRPSQGPAQGAPVTKFESPQPRPMHLEIQGCIESWKFPAEESPRGGAVDLRWTRWTLFFVFSTRIHSQA